MNQNQKEILTYVSKEEVYWLSKKIEKLNYYIKYMEEMKTKESDMSSFWVLTQTQTLLEAIESTQRKIDYINSLFEGL